MGLRKSRADRVLRELISWTPHSEQDLYFYVKEFFRHVLGYPKDSVVIGETGRRGTPDISLCSVDVRPKDRTYWAVGEVKKEPGLFRDPAAREESWARQLKRYLTADTVYALLIEPKTIAVFRPDGRELKTVPIDQVTEAILTNPIGPNSLAFLSYENSVSDRSLGDFKDGRAPSRYIDVTAEDGREKFYTALRISAQELINYSAQRLKTLLGEYEIFKKKLREIEDSLQGELRDESYEVTVKHLRKQRQESVKLVEEVLPTFEQQIGKAVPGGGKRLEAL